MITANKANARSARRKARECIRISIRRHCSHRLLYASIPAKWLELFLFRVIVPQRLNDSPSLEFVRTYKDRLFPRNCTHPRIAAGIRSGQESLWRTTIGRKNNYVVGKRSVARGYSEDHLGRRLAFHVAAHQQQRTRKENVLPVPFTEPEVSIRSAPWYPREECSPYHFPHHKCPLWLT